MNNSEVEFSHHCEDEESTNNKEIMNIIINQKDHVEQNHPHISQIYSQSATQLLERLWK